MILRRTVFRSRFQSFPSRELPASFAFFLVPSPRGTCVTRWYRAGLPGECGLLEFRLRGQVSQINLQRGSCVCRVIGRFMEKDWSRRLRLRPCLDGGRKWLHRVFCQPAEFDCGDSGRRQHSISGGRHSSAIDCDGNLQQWYKDRYQFR